MELNLDLIAKVYSVEHRSLKQDIQWFHVVSCFAHAVIHHIKMLKVNHGQSLTLFQVQCINLSMDILHIWIVQPYVFIKYLIVIDELLLQFRHVTRRTSSIPWPVHVVIMIMSIQQQKHWLMLWLVCMTLIITSTFYVFYFFFLNTDHRKHGNRIIQGFPKR